MARRTARKSRRKSRKSKRRGRRSRRRQRGGHAKLSPAELKPENPVVEEAGEAPPAEDAPADEAQTGGKRKRKRKGKTAKKQKGGKRKLNAFFKAMLAAKKSKAKSFKYKGKTYKGRKHHRLGMIYSKA